MPHANDQSHGIPSLPNDAPPHSTRQRPTKRRIDTHYQIRWNTLECCDTLCVHPAQAAPLLYSVLSAAPERQEPTSADARFGAAHSIPSKADR